MTAARAHADELADGRVDEPRRVVVAVAAAGAVDEHDVLADLLAPAAAGTPRATAARRRALRSFFTVLRDDVVAGGHRARPRRVREDVHLRRARLLDDPQRVPNAASSSAGKPTITSVVRLKSARERRPGAGTSPSRSGGPSRAARRRRPTGAGRAGAGTRSASRGARRASRSFRWLTSIEDSRSRASPGVAPASRTSRGRS